MLDVSGSITKENFNNVRSFVKKFVDALTIGPEDSQVGVIVFGNNATALFNLTTYDNKSDIVEAIDNYSYHNSAKTNTADALCKLKDGFSEDNGARAASVSVFRFAMVLTDGKSNRNSSECNTNTIEAARAVHNLKPPILVYAIGVTKNDSIEELKVIASSPHGYGHIDSFGDLPDVGEEYIGELCTEGIWCIDIYVA